VGKPPSDAIILFDGSNFDHWESIKGGEVKWKLIDGAMEVVRGTGTIQTKEKLGYGQYHVEWCTPKEVKGNGQGRGNSGFFPLSGPEVQVLDSYKNSTYSHGQGGVDLQPLSTFGECLSGTRCLADLMMLSCMHPLWIKMVSIFERVLIRFCIMASDPGQYGSGRKARERQVTLGSRIMVIRYATEISGIVHTANRFR
jgi:hypothetical protein